MQRTGVIGRNDCDRLEAEGARRSEDAECDLTPVGDQYFLHVEPG